MKGQEDMKEQICRGQQELKDQMKADIASLMKSQEAKFEALESEFIALKRAVKEDQGKVRDHIASMAKEAHKWREEYQSLFAKIAKLEQKQVADDDIFQQFFEKLNTLRQVGTIATKDVVWDEIEKLWKHYEDLKVRLEDKCAQMQQRLDDLEGSSTETKLNSPPVKLPTRFVLNEGQWNSFDDEVACHHLHIGDYLLIA
ncbi:uncharacterized protein LOC144362797 [Saccoglossus kowalevskii]